ncbi:MAG: hypothetical protein D4R90_03775 [Nitrosopumilales archaeon]|nr:MAG: hypothetical protein D4R90_03775 [Nitrosopumilales archaeon]
MNKAVIAGLAILVLVMGVGSNLIFHLAEAKTMPSNMIKLDNSVKGKFFLAQKGNSSEKKYPKIIGYTAF